MALQPVRGASGGIAQDAVILLAWAIPNLSVLDFVRETRATKSVAFTLVQLLSGELRLSTEGSNDHAPSSFTACDARSSGDAFSTCRGPDSAVVDAGRSEEHTSELQSRQ